MQKRGRVQAWGLGRALGDVRVTSLPFARAALVSQLSCSPLHSALSGGDGRRTERRTDSYDGRGSSAFGSEDGGNEDITAPIGIQGPLTEIDLGISFCITINL